MKFWISYTTIIVLLAVLFSLTYYLVSPAIYKPGTFVSPIPNFLQLNNNSQATFLDFWSPVLETYASTNDKPDIQAKSALMYDLVHNQALYENAPQARLPMASLTKIMTAIVALEDKTMPQLYIAHGDDLVGEDSMGITPKEILAKEELLYGLLLNSGNDAAEVLAHNYPGGKPDFLAAMHNKAKVLGLQNTKFSNVTGLQGDGQQYTTAHDLLIMTKYALETFPEFKKIVSTYEHFIPATSTHKAYDLINETNLISSYPGVQGVKTGYTPEAGMCLVTYYEKDGIKLIGIILDSPNRRTEMRDMLDYSLKRLGVTPPKHD